MATTPRPSHTGGSNHTVGSNHTAGSGNNTTGNSTSGWGGHGSNSSWSSGGSGGSSGSGWGSPAYAAAVAKRTAANQQTLKTYAGCLCAFILFFTVIHWTRRLFVNRSSARGNANHRPSALTRGCISLSRRVRNVMVRKLRGFNSTGHGALVCVWVAVLVVLTFTNVDLSSASNLAPRFGWMTAGSLALVVFLSLKNTPLAFLTAYSYERINNLHQMAGCTMFTFMCLHAITYTSYFASVNELQVVTLPPQRAAITAGFSFLSSVIAALFIRRVQYELFYAMHVLFFVIGIICVGFHQPSFALGIVIIVVFAASIWGADRALRASRVVYNSINNDAAVYPLPNGGTRIVLKKTPGRAVPGKHCFLWVPSLRLLQMHPFTIVGTRPLEFCINSYDGFTAALHQYAVKHPGGRLRASVDGPYGTFPDPMEYDKIVLIAGGSGASFTFGVAVNLLERMSEACTKQIVFIWAVRSTENLAWYSSQLKTLRTHAHSPKVAVSLYVTRLDSTGDLAADDARRLGHRTTTMSSQSSDAQSPVSPHSLSEKPSFGLPPRPHYRPIDPLRRDPEKEKEEEDELARPNVPPAASPYATTLANSSNADHRSLDLSTVSIPSIPPIPHEHSSSSKAAAAASPTSPTAHHVGHTTTNPDTEAGGGDDAAAEPLPQLHHAVTRGRPDAATLIRDAVASTPRHQRVLVAACGPSSMMSTVRDTAAECIRPDGPGVELHCEQFGW